MIASLSTQKVAGVPDLFSKALGLGLSPAGRRGRLAVFCYHQVLEHKDPFRPDEPCQLDFGNDLEVIKNTFNVLPVPEAVRRLAQGSLPSRAACITFDDGYANNHQIAAPLLEKAGLPATFFIASGAVDSGIMWNDLVIETFSRTVDSLTTNGVFDFELAAPGAKNSAAVGEVLANIKYKPLDERWGIAHRFFETNVGKEIPRLMMTPDMVADLSNRGFDIGGHTINHPILAELTNDRAAQEIEGSLDWLQKVTGHRPFSFAYPNGKPGVDFNEQHALMVANAGCGAAFSTGWGVGKRTSSEFDLPRVGPWWRTGRSLPIGLFRLYAGSYAH